MAYKMLVVEDNAFTANLLAVLFEGLGFEVHLIENGLDALPYLKANHVDVMILDLELPGMTGDRIYAAMRGNPVLKDIPVVPFTAHRDTQSPNTLPTNLIWAEYTKTGKIPDIVFKNPETGDPKDINRELVDEVAWKLMHVQKPITKEMADYYLQTRGMTPEDVIR